MWRPALIACFPWLCLLMALSLGLWLLLRLCRPPISWQRLVTLHRNETGGVQSLSFVATLPIFVMVIMLIVQVSQVMIANIVVQYAAFAAARSAMVWLPARVEPDERENRLDAVLWIERYDAGSYGDGYPVYQVLPARYSPSTSGGNSSAKLLRIHRAAALACMPLAPSRDGGGSSSGSSTPLIDSATRVYQSVAPRSTSNLRLPRRMANKLSYSLENTTIEFRRTAPHDYLVWWLPTQRWEWGASWHDQLTLTVTHQYALLPGPGRLLARSVVRGGQDSVGGRIGRTSGFYTIPITATVTLPNEGEVSQWRYVHQQMDVVD